MKRTEATDEAVESNDQVPASGHDTAVDKALTMEQRRRRLVRGAAALAPLVLTLRSGALAAASCTGVKALGVTTGYPTVIPEAGEGDWCATGYQACGDHKIVTQFGADFTQVEVTPDPNQTGFTCKVDGPIAILSGGAYHSIVHT